MLEVIVNMTLDLGTVAAFLIICILFCNAEWTAEVSTYCMEFNDSYLIAD
jgi:hypothetical protein